jgi:chromosome segregation ATPase
LERQKHVITSELEVKQHELAESEDYLLRKLEHLTKHDEIIEKKLEEKEDEINDLSIKLREVEMAKAEMSDRINALSVELKDKEIELQKSYDLQEENAELTKEVTILQGEIKKNLADFDKKMKARDVEIDEMENELSNQLTKVENERKLLQENLEKSNDRNAELQEEISRTRDSLNHDGLELQELRMQVVQDQTEIENLKQQIADMEAINEQMDRNQTDDQAMLQQETEKLRELLTEKEAEIVKYQQRNLQLQMASMTNTAEDPFSSLGGSDGAKNEHLEEKIRDLENDLTLKDARIQELQIEKNLLEEQVQDMRRPPMVEETIAALRLQAVQATPTNDQMVDLKAQIVQKDAIIQALKDEIEVISAQQQNLAAEVQHKTKQLEDLSRLLCESQEKCAILEDAKSQPSIASFFGGDSTASAFEEVIVPKKAYECYDHEEKIDKLDKEIASLLATNAKLEEQIKLQQDDIDILTAKNNNLKEELQHKAKSIEELIKTMNDYQDQICTLEEELENSRKQQPEPIPSTAAFFAGQTVDQAGGVFEEIITPKKTYQCYPAVGSFDVEEDVWGGEEALLEEKHQQATLVSGKC